MSISPTNSIRVSPPVSSTIEIENPQQLSNRIINTGSRIGSYNNRSTYINHDALVLRSQLLSKNMREGTFNFTTAKFDPYAPLYITTPDGSSQLCQTYDVDWNTGNYAIQNGFPSTPWCIGNIALNINI